MFYELVKVECGAPQGSILGPSFFHMNLTDMFYKCEDSDTENFAVDITPYACACDVDTVILNHK